MKKLFALLLAVVTVFTLAACGKKESKSNYPTQSIDLIIPFGQGAADTESRMYGQYLAEALGTTVLGSNVTGGSGGVGMAKVAESKADGYTVGFASASIPLGMASGNISMTPADLQVVCTFNCDWIGLWVGKSSPFHTFQEFVDYCKAHPGELNVGGTNVASAHYTLYKTLCKEAGIDFNYVAFDGSAGEIQSIIGGTLDAAFLEPGYGGPYVESDGFRCLLVAKDERDARYPDTVCTGELGYKNASEIVMFRSLVAPKGLSDDVLAVLDKATEAAFNSADYQKYLSDNSITPLYKNHTEASEYFNNFYERAKTIFAEVN